MEWNVAWRYPTGLSQISLYYSLGISHSKLDLVVLLERAWAYSLFPLKRGNTMEREYRYV